MSFSPALMIMHPREISEVIESVKSVVSIPRVWFKGFNEVGVMQAMNAFVAETNYSHYIISSDDAIIYKNSFDTVLKFGALCDSDVFTGYCNMHMEQVKLTKTHFNREIVSDLTNVHYAPLTQSMEAGPTVADYRHWGTMAEVLNEKGLFQQYMAGMALTCYPRKTLIQIPLNTHLSGNSSDHYMSRELHKANIKIWTHPDAFLMHLRKGWHSLHDKWVVNKIKPIVIKELDVSKHEVMDDVIKAKYDSIKPATLETAVTSVWSCEPPLKRLSRRQRLLSKDYKGLI